MARLLLLLLLLLGGCAGRYIYAWGYRPDYGLTPKERAAAIEEYVRPEYRDAVRHNRIARGMTRAEALLSWGRPLTRNQDDAGRESWVIRQPGPWYTEARSFLHFDEDGLVSSWDQFP